MRTCRKCLTKVHARGMCYQHYMEWYQLNRHEAKRLRNPKQRKWKFTPEHWWSWWENRTPDVSTFQRRSEIQLMRRTLR